MMHTHKKPIPKKAWPFVVVSGLIQLWALIDIIKSSVFIRGNKALWLCLVFVMPPFGALAYYAFGREAF
ncbi:PLDc N-terminal domain-containing protein [Paucilactobacillus wasatchensis]|uniref:Cardiolipin synthase N-terminal domain-containing protein n=1 Tax=Paucilactobacillus wasatchensis TaxID=1335616 RepID=A0A0D1A4K8_9LACO|nr:PLD nuclease N-terminal domain-containing protein [Paucilactobacillus wasatchensis]KIS02617.1 hypothetical protein WDC_1808 [Paucilactobacillus wasatchensis]